LKKELEVRKLDIHSKLNAQQRTVVNNIGGILRVMSGPGTGKTLTSVHYIAEIISTQKAQPKQILAVTFTNKAANELKERVLKMVGKCSDVSTIHSFCASVLRKYPPLGYSENFTILDETGQFITTCNLIRRLRIDKHPRVILERLTLARNLRDINILKEEELEDFYKVYMTSLQEQDIIDYDGLLTWSLYVFEKNPSALEYFRNKYKFVLVDEFQDTSPIQLAIIKLLVEKNRNLFVVGDPDQSIYRFRGADVSIMVELDKVFPELKTYYLSQNYRSTKAIVKGANNLMNNNKKRTEKPLWSQRGEGEKPVILGFDDETKEAEFVASYIEKEINKGKRYEDFAILYRVNFLGNEFETFFSGKGIPYQIVGGTGYFQRAEIKNVLAFFKLVANPSDNESFLRSCSVLSQVSGSSTRNFKNNFVNVDIPLIDVAYMAKESFIRTLPDFINQISKQKNLVDMFELILEKTQYLEYLKKDTSTEGERKVENLEELKSVLTKYRESGRGLEEFLEQIENVHEEENENSVKLLTAHAAKGLEFDTVFLVGVEKGMYPHFKAKTEEDIEEERRLFYVGVTRAENKLFITYPKKKHYKGEEIKVYPSKFINELKVGHDPFVTGIEYGKVSKDAISEGSIVFHASFGRGYIKSISEGSIGGTIQTKVKVDFSGIEKILILELAPLKLV